MKNEPTNDAVRVLLNELVSDAIVVVVDWIAACRTSLEAAEPGVRMRAIERWGADEAWKEFAPDSLIRFERHLSTLATETAQAKARGGNRARD